MGNKAHSNIIYNINNAALKRNTVPIYNPYLQAGQRGAFSKAPFNGGCEGPLRSRPNIPVGTPSHLLRLHRGLRGAGKEPSPPEHGTSEPPGSLQLPGEDRASPTKWQGVAKWVCLVQQEVSFTGRSHFHWKCSVCAPQHVGYSHQHHLECRPEPSTSHRTPHRQEPLRFNHAQTRCCHGSRNPKWPLNQLEESQGSPPAFPESAHGCRAGAKVIISCPGRLSRSSGGCLQEGCHIHLCFYRAGSRWRGERCDRAQQWPKYMRMVAALSEVQDRICFWRQSGERREKKSCFS